MAAEYIAQRGNLDIVLCERGIRTFETGDPQHPRHLRGAGRAAAVAPAGDRRPVARRRPARPGRAAVAGPAIAVGADGIIVDVHPHPETALCDGPQALIESDLRELASVALHLSPLVGRTLTPAPAGPSPVRR